MMLGQLKAYKSYFLPFWREPCALFSAALFGVKSLNASLIFSMWTPSYDM